MSMDLNAIKNRLQSLQNKKSGGSKEDRSKYFWKPSVGKQVIRIVPSKFDKSNPFKEVLFHYGIGNRTMVALSNWGEKDPIVEFTSQLRKTSDKENWRLAKKIEPKMRIFAPVIVRGEEEKGVRLWEFGKAMYMELLSMAEDEDIGDYTSIVDGRDLTIETTGPDTNGTMYNKSSIRVRTKQTPLSENNAQVKEWLNEQPDVMSLYKKYEFDEMKSLLMNYLNPEEEVEATEDSDDTDSDVIETPKSNYSEPAPKKKSNFDEDEFDSLFND
jgi:hypothetical protein